MLIIAVIVAVSIGITKAKLDNIVSYTYYNAYSSLRKISTEMLADWDPKDPEYKQALNSEETPKLAQIDFSIGFQNSILTTKDRILSIYRNLWLQPVLASEYLFENGDSICLRMEFGGSSYRQYCCPKPTHPEYIGGASRRGSSNTNYKCVVDCLDGSTASSYSACPSQEVTCWDGSKAPNDASCPPKIQCWDGSYATSSSKCPKATCWNGTQANTPSDCPPKISCWDGSFTTSEASCPSYVTCWNGTKAHNYGGCPACTNKPNPIPCGQSWDENTCSLKGTAKTCSDGYSLDSSCNCKCTRTCGSGYTLNSSSCTCVKNKVPCWDGTEADSEAQCPGFVTCWNGSKAHNYDECPPCPNKPSTIPCGQGWDETTCKLTGTAKTCPSGQHLNSGCNCVKDCPSAAELTPCRLCSNETGEVTKNMAINRTCSDETYEWSEEQCKCIISPRTLPRKGENFCKLFERHSNIMGNTDVCSGSVISDGTTNFADKKADITLRNGLRIYNMHRDATALPILAGNTQGGVYDGVPNTNSWGYTVYVDIDGIKGDSQLWSDVFPFYITLSGKIIPGYDSSNPGISGGDSTRHLQVSIQYEDYSSGKRRMKWLSKSVPFKEGACQAGYVGEATPYCRNNSAISKLNECTTDGNSMCTLKHIEPVKFFF